jgi:pimeloyl-ACP methyl ester carboxylesterase
MSDLNVSSLGSNFTEGSANVNGIRLHYVRGGQGEPLVLLHGWPQTWFCWHRLMPALAEHFTVIAIDLRGAGQSSRPELPTAYDSVTMANDVRELMAQLGFESIRIAGHDVGLLVAFAYAALYPEDVSRLVVLDGLLVGIEPMTTGFLRDPRSWLFGFVQTPDLPEKLVLGREREFFDWVFAAIAFNRQAIDSKELDTYIEAYSQPGAMQASFGWFRAFEAVSAFNQSYTTKKITVPVLALGGDKMMGGFMVPMMQSVAEDVRGGAISASGHWVIEEQPETLLRELLSFLP